MKIKNPTHFPHLLQILWLMKKPAYMVLHLLSQTDMLSSGEQEMSRLYIGTS